MSVLRIPATVSEMDGSAGDSEADLVARAKRDREALAEMYRRFYPMVSRYVYRRTGSVHATEDLVSDVFLTVLRTLPRYRYRGVPLRFWLLRIATNAVNRWARRARRNPAVSLQITHLEAGGVAMSSAHHGIDEEHARRALLSLPPKFQTVLSLHYFEGLAVKEMAAVIGCREGTVKSRLARARDALRTELNGRR
ncbi:MAG: RNA polymerase sigma factor [Phycisphaerales bacterium]|nr:MAG: RNA polymerase sigma factor [Phycisphaerales bacterium]